MSLHEARIAAIEARYAITFPEDFRTYLAAEGSGEDRLDYEVTLWWGLDTICSVTDGYEHPVNGELDGVCIDKYILFADHMAWSWAWAINCGDDQHRGKVVVIDGGRDRFIANSFHDFLRLYAEDPALKM